MESAVLEQYILHQHLSLGHNIMAGHDDGWHTKTYQHDMINLQQYTNQPMMNDEQQLSKHTSVAWGHLKYEKIMEAKMVTVTVEYNWSTQGSRNPPMSIMMESMASIWDSAPHS